MNIHKFIPQFQLNALTGDHGYPHNAIKSGVLVPLCDINNKLHVLLCKRPSYLKHHPGQICFPGGKLEKSDMSLQDTAIRETHEELGIIKSEINLLGQMNSYWTLTGFEIKPYIGVIDANVTIIPQKNEVVDTFFLPFNALTQKNNWIDLNFTRNHKKIILKGFMTEYGLLWGATAQIILNLVAQITPNKNASYSL
ncbi:NUDIX hydrolase [Pseudoalteromonas denitrificans]|uniref:8-oxo-dGTP pyrophosphatase MutT, NUDIX family n=1 Tax=Pseudoalteromonas denitrificans DSM 6059 TaxID=1123010 RepID=A0A1I1KTE3_9GAMM|nr:CoA pyrophosphatase [Pseudoalteromonas denitrificans]SFC64069.1 8-oxo-dGTP pyrophosphatase MutT, NUDIX family [Pseudoalteromonas denitrificans DSM 6059]